MLYPLGLVALLRKSCPASVNVVATPEVFVPLVIIPGTGILIVSLGITAIALLG